jgi:hypothetical protein
MFQLFYLEVLLMQMTIIFSASSQRFAMMFNEKTDSLDDLEILSKFPEWVRESDAYTNLKQQLDLSVDRIELPETKNASHLAGDHLYKYLSKGYLCLGNYVGNPKPNMSHLGILSVKRVPKVGFFIDMHN